MVLSTKGKLLKIVCPHALRRDHVCIREEVGNKARDLIIQKQLLEMVAIGDAWVPQSSKHVHPKRLVDTTIINQIKGLVILWKLAWIVGHDHPLEGLLQLGLHDEEGKAVQKVLYLNFNAEIWLLVHQVTRSS